MSRRERYLNSICYALLDTEMVTTRFALAMSSAVWAVLLWWPGETFGRPTYNGMAHVMPEEAWAFVFMLDAVMQLTIILQQDFHSRFARYFAAFNAALWGGVVLSMLLSIYPPPAAISAEIVMAFCAIWIWARPYVLAIGYRRAYASTL